MMEYHDIFHEKKSSKYITKFVATYYFFRLTIYQPRTHKWKVVSIFPLSQPRDGSPYQRDVRKIIAKRITNYTHQFTLNVQTYPCITSTGIRVWINDYFPHQEIGVISFSCHNLSYNLLVKGACDVKRATIKYCIRYDLKIKTLFDFRCGLLCQAYATVYHAELHSTF